MAEEGRYDMMIPSVETESIVDELRWAAERLVRGELDGGYVRQSDDGCYHVVVHLNQSATRPTGFYAFQVTVRPGIAEGFERSTEIERGAK